MILFCQKNYRARLARRGFTVIEVMVSLFVFTLVLTSVTQIFGAAFTGYRATRSVGQDIENIQYAINILAKELRTSSVVSASGNKLLVKFFDHSQDKCFLYQINAGALQMASAGSTGVSDCNGMALASPATISTGTVQGSFQVRPSATVGGPPTRVGKVTISLRIAEDATHFANIQTTVSLRDFGNIGL